MWIKNYQWSAAACLALGIALFSLVSVMAKEPAAPAAAQPSPLTLAPATAMLETTGHWEWQTTDPTVTDPAQAEGQPGWSHLPGDLDAGYTEEALWLRLHLHAPQADSWMLLFHNALLDDVHVYLRAVSPSDTAHTGPWSLLNVSGEHRPRSQWPVDFRSPAIPLDITQPGHYSVLVRLSSRNAINGPVHIWERLAFDNHSRREGLVFGLIFGFYLMQIALHTLFWRATQSANSGLFLAYLGLCMAAYLLTLGLAQQLLGLSGPWSDRLLGCAMSLSLPVLVQLALRQLQLATYWPRLSRGLLTLSVGTALVCAVAVVLGHFALGVQWLQAVSTPALLLLSALAVVLLHRGQSHARFFLWVFLPFYATLLGSFARNSGLLPANMATEALLLISTFLHMLLLSLWIVGDYLRERQGREREKILLQAQLAQQQHREAELHQALELERRVRQEQRDFVAMVSHEFRTPLAVINTSAQQLARNLQAPAEKTLLRSQNIRAAAQRLLTLVDDCLSEDRIGEPLAAPQLTPCNLPALLEQLAQDFPPGRLNFIHDANATALHTDTSLLSIALRNLVANADRHTAQGQVVRIHTQRQGERLHIEVANPSPRLSEEDQAHLFERHWRGSNAQHLPGAGLGLYLVRRIAEKLGGGVHLRTAGGTEAVCFRLELPLYPGH